MSYLPSDEHCATVCEFMLIISDGDSKYSLDDMMKLNYVILSDLFASLTKVIRYLIDVFDVCGPNHYKVFIDTGAAIVSDEQDPQIKHVIGCVVDINEKIKRSYKPVWYQLNCNTQRAILFVSLFKKLHQIKSAIERIVIDDIDKGRSSAHRSTVRPYDAVDYKKILHASIVEQLLLVRLCALSFRGNLDLRYYKRSIFSDLWEYVDIVDDDSYYGDDDSYQGYDDIRT